MPFEPHFSYLDWFKRRIFHASNVIEELICMRNATFESIMFDRFELSVTCVEDSTVSS